MYKILCDSKKNTHLVYLRQVVSSHLTRDEVSGRNTTKRVPETKNVITLRPVSVYLCRLSNEINVGKKILR